MAEEGFGFFGGRGNTKGVRVTEHTVSHVSGSWKHTRSFGTSPPLSAPPKEPRGEASDVVEAFMVAL